MATKSGIQWTDMVWNPIVGCRPISEGCQQCYASRQASRGMVAEHRGLTDGRRWNGRVNLLGGRLGDLRRLRKPRRIFVGSMTDLFYEKVPEAYIFSVLNECERAANNGHVLQILTKRAGRMADVIPRWIEHFRKGGCEPRTDRMWLGVTTENQKRLEDRVPKMLSIRGGFVFWVSAEPLLGPLNFYGAGSMGPEWGDPRAFSALEGYDSDPPIPPLNWVVVGGESGKTARVCDQEWIAKVVRDCNVFSVPCFVKQMGSNSVRAGIRRQYRHSKGGDPKEWHPAICVQQFPSIS